MKCFYHRSDLDGLACGAILTRAYPEAEMIGIEYGDPFDWDQFDPDEEVVMADFSMQPFSDMVRLSEACGRLVWIDHHKSAIEEYANSHLNLAGVRRIGIGACLLAWEYIHASPVPRAVQLLAEYDVWDHHDPACMPFQYGIRMEHTGPSSPLWDRLLADDPDELLRIIEQGHLVLAYQGKQNADHAATLCFDGELDGLRLICANAGSANSQFFDSVWNRDRCDAMCLFSWRPNANAWTVSLYSDKDDVDVSVVAKSRGGGGHKGAAGFQTIHPMPLLVAGG